MNKLTIVIAAIIAIFIIASNYFLLVAERQEERKLEEEQEEQISGQDGVYGGYSAIIQGTRGLSAEEKQKILNDLVEKNGGGFYSITWGE